MGWLEAFISFDSPRRLSPAQFKSMPVKWHVANDSSTIYQFNPDNAGLKRVFEKHFAQLKTYIKANKLKPKQEADLINLFQYYNELLQQ